MRKLFYLAALACSTATQAQQQDVTLEQAFKGAPIQLVQPLPEVVKWIDNDHYLESRKSPEGTWQQYSVDIKTGNSSIVESPAKTKSTPIAGARNQTTSPDGKFVAYTRTDNNLYVTEIATGKESRLTQDGNDSLLNGYASWIYYEEILGRASRYKAFWWSDDSRHLAFMRFDETGVPVFPIYVADNQHGYLEQERYPKPGDKNPNVKIGIVSLDNNQTTWADFNEKDDQYFAAPVWAPDGKLWVQWMNRGQDNLKVFSVGNDGSKKLVYEEQQKTWIDLDDYDRIEFLSSGKGFILKSDASGWRHLSLYDITGKKLAQLTDGQFTVGDIHEIDEKGKKVYFSARKENSARWDLYSVGFDGKQMNRLSFGDYSFTSMRISPDHKHFLTTYSNLQSVPTLALVDSKGKLVKTIATAKGKDFSNYTLPKKEIIRVKSTDGLFDLPVQITYPLNFDPNKKYPVLVSIYGGPNAGTVYDQFRYSAQELWWAKEGMVQVAFDNRSSGHFGKYGMNFIHRQLGLYEIQDFMACAKHLKTLPWVNPSKVAITGGSFGGYMTCMALTYGADVFDYGVANASVTDWKLYDTHYTERFMDTPAENPEGYKNTSVMTYVAKYKGLLRIVHGTTDDNVHMQNSIQLIDAMEDLGKHFEMMVYPNERHGIGANKATKRYHNNFEAAAFYYRNLLEKPLPAGLWKQETKGF
ncbi:S9 family peptidase [Flavihumibacter petaseus]|uniref:Peptidase S9 family protein n=1 Tax=Flavihumibacter petaseus NBRC 106054 TaxID=1220578 RepID=A0A0E9MW62_9BACT|nr:DPP IV N-terminal domain-containing protein [Flavihumibacter petaseus]GAO41743.1 peptidase S9 family protein [Flavihumibacter petaseus NBRC 106054]